MYNRVRLVVFGTPSPLFFPSALIRLAFISKNRLCRSGGCFRKKGIA